MSTRASNRCPASPRLTPILRPNFSRAGSRRAAPGKAGRMLPEASVLPPRVIPSPNRFWMSRVVSRSTVRSAYNSETMHSMRTWIGGTSISVMTSRMASTSLLGQGPDDDLVGAGVGRHGEIRNDLGFLAFGVENPAGELVANDGFQFFRGMVFGEIEEFPLLGSADDLFDFLGRQLVDGRDGDVRLFDGIDFRELPQDILGFDRRNPLVGPVVAAHETHGSQNSTSHR